MSAEGLFTIASTSPVLISKTTAEASFAWKRFTPSLRAA